MKMNADFLKRQAVPLLVLAGLVTLAVLGVLNTQRAPIRMTIDCPDPVAGCAFDHPGRAPQVRFSMRPEPLKPFDLWVSNTTSPGASVSFRMDGMDMGFNRYDMKPDGNMQWRARVTLPVCTTSRADWVAELSLNGQVYAVHFHTAGR